MTCPNNLSPADWFVLPTPNSPRWPSYQAGETVYQLSKAYGIHRQTVATLLKRAGVQTRWYRLSETDILIDLYTSGTV